MKYVALTLRGAARTTLTQSLRSTAAPPPAGCRVTVTS
jgi:hypothetical protein